MTIGKGKYDSTLSCALEVVGGQRGAFIVLDGKHGPGFAVQGCMDTMKKLPELLEHIAKEIRKDLPELKEQT